MTDPSGVVETQPENAPKRAIYVRVSAELDQQIRDRAALERRPLSWVVRDLLSSGLAVKGLREASQLACDVLFMLDQHPTLLAHYLDNDDNDGERLREIHRGLGIEPSDRIRKESSDLRAIE